MSKASTVVGIILVLLLVVYFLVYYFGFFRVRTSFEGEVINKYHKPFASGRSHFNYWVLVIDTEEGHRWKVRVSVKNFRAIDVGDIVWVEVSAIADRENEVPHVYNIAPTV